MYGAKTCQQVAGRRLEEPVLRAVFAALAPAALAATVQALKDSEARHRQDLAVFERAAERARFEAGRARRQYDNVEPENRLVARTLEAALEARLAAVRTASNQLAAQQARRPVTLTEQEAAWITVAGADLRAVFDAPTTSNVQRKQLFRALITEIVVTVARPAAAGPAAVRIIWQGGASTELTVPLARTGQHSRVTSEETLDLVRRLAGHYNDTTIAQILGQQGRRTATGLTWTKTHISQLRAYHDIPDNPPAENVTPGRDDALVVTIAAGKRRAQRVHRDPLPVATGRLPHRGTAHPRRAVAHPHRPATPRPDHSPGPRRLGHPRRRSQDPRDRPPDRVAQGPARRAQRRPSHPGPPARPAYPGRTRPAWTV